MTIGNPYYEEMYEIYQEYIETEREAILTNELINLMCDKIEKQKDIRLGIDDNGYKKLEELAGYCIRRNFSGISFFLLTKSFQVLENLHTHELKAILNETLPQLGYGHILSFI